MIPSRSVTRGVHAMRWPLALAISAAVFFIVGVSTVRQTYRVWQVDQEIKTLQNEIDELQGKRLALSDLLNKINSADELDKQARLHLDLKKAGEELLILRGVDAATADTGETPLSQDAPRISNPKKWLRRFFAP